MKILLLKYPNIPEIYGIKHLSFIQIFLLFFPPLENLIFKFEYISNAFTCVNSFTHVIILKIWIGHSFHTALQLAFSCKNMSWRSVHVIKIADYCILRMYINLFNNFFEAGIKIHSQRPPEIHLWSKKKSSFTELAAARENVP